MEVHNCVSGLCGTATDAEKERGCPSLACQNAPPKGARHGKVSFHFLFPFISFFPWLACLVQTKQEPHPPAPYLMPGLVQRKHTQQHNNNTLTHKQHLSCFWPSIKQEPHLLAPWLSIPHTLKTMTQKKQEEISASGPARNRSLTCRLPGCPPHTR